MSPFAERLQAVGFPLRSAATAEEIAETERAIGVLIPGIVRDLYLTTDGLDPIPYAEENEASIDGIFRLMSLSEVVEIHPGLAEWGWNTAERICLFTNDNSDFVSFCVAGPLLGKVLLLAHDDPDFSPVWRSVESFLEAIIAVGKKGFPDPFTISGADYPQLSPGSPEAEAADVVAIGQLRQRFETEDRVQGRQDIAYQIITLTPFEQTADILPFTHDTDDDVQAKACRVLGQRKSAPAIPRLAQVAMTSYGNAPGAAIEALGDMQTPDAFAMLIELIEKVSPERISIITFKNALQQYGVTFSLDQGKELIYQLPDEEPKPFRLGGITPQKKRRP